MPSVLKRSLWFAGFTALFAAVMAAVFWGTWSPEVSFVQPDQPVIYPADFLLRRWAEICGGGSFVPGDLRFVLGGPYAWQELQYALAMYLAALGVVYYLKGRGLPPLACYGAAAAYGFMGYNFTLFSAGHLGWFIYLMYGPFCFGLIDRCVRKGRWVNWVLLGGVLAWSSAQQPDIWLLFAVMAFAYGLFRAVREVKGAPSGAKGGRAVRILLGTALTAAVLAAVGWPQLHKAIFEETANRDKQIAGATATHDAEVRPKSAAETKAEREKRYIFCTNWSLPPDELLEFAVPDIKGGSSDPRVSPKNPYRGRIGAQVAPGRWSPYRQHSLYMGFFSICLAVAGILFGLWPRKKGASAFCVAPENRAEIAFWSVAAVVLLICAMGGFTPFYRLVFLLPMGDYIRCPLKFVHLVEWCLAVLMGFGIAALINLPLARRAPRIAAAALAALALVNMLNLAAVDSRYCAVDPSDTIRIALARETGTCSIGFVMDGSAPLNADEYILAGGTAFRDNAALKAALASKDCVPVSFWNFHGRRLVKTPRERAGFVLLKTRNAPPPPVPAANPGIALIISIVSTLAVCLLALSKLKRFNNNPKGGSHEKSS